MYLPNNISIGLCSYVEELWADSETSKLDVLWTVGNWVGQRTSLRFVRSKWAKYRWPYHW